MTMALGTMITAMVTPMTQGNAGPVLDLEEARRLASALVDQGSDGLVICGSTGEGPTVSFEEEQMLVAAVADVVGNRAAVIANVGANSTEATLERIGVANTWPIDGIMVVVPFYNKPPQEGIYRHFAAAAQASTHPIVMYNIPSRTGVNMTAETAVRLAGEFPMIAAIKEASGRDDQIDEIIACAPSGFRLYSGDDEAALAIISRGGAGVISTIGNIAPTPMRALTDAALGGDFDAARILHESMAPLMRGLFETTNPILVKAALGLLGLQSTALRLPLVEATAEQIQRLHALMNRGEVPLLSLE